MNALLAAHHGVPVALATGDEAFAKELGELLPDTEFVAVKRAIRRTTAELLHPEVTAPDPGSRHPGARVHPGAARGAGSARRDRDPVHAARPGGDRLAAAANRTNRPDTVRFEAGTWAAGYARHPCPLPQSVRMRRRPEMFRTNRCTPLLIVLALLFAAGAPALEEETSNTDLAVPLHAKLGTVSYPVSGASELGQQYFDQDSAWCTPSGWRKRGAPRRGGASRRQRDVALGPGPRLRPLPQPGEPPEDQLETAWEAITRARELSGTATRRKRR